MNDLKILLSIVLALLVSGAGFWARVLDFSGFLAAVFVGAAIFWGAGLPGAAALIFFFVSGSALSRLPSKIEMPEQKARRDWRQVLANGFWGAVLSFVYGFNPNETYYLDYVGALAVACADTVSGEVGMRWAKRTIALANFRLVSPGQSGAVSLIGTLAGLIGAVLIAMVGIFTRGWGLVLSWKLIGIIGGIGFLGALFDSVLGAWLQGKYRCSVCGRSIEAGAHCGRSAERTSGVGSLDNDGVNFLATLFGAVLGLILF